MTRAYWAGYPVKKVTRKKRHLPKQVRLAIESALRHADMMATAPGPRGATPICAVADQHKEAMKIYLDTWVMGPLEQVLQWDDDELAAFGIADWR